MSEDASSRFRWIFDATFEFLGLLSPEGTVEEANQTALSFIGAAREDVVGRPFWETGWWHGDEQKARLKDGIRQAAAGAFVRFDVTHKDTQGREHTFDFSIKPVRDEGGAVRYLIAEGRDVGDFVRSHSRFRELLEAAPDAILEVNPSGCIVLINNAAERLLGYTRDELLGISVDTLLPDSLRGAHAAHRRSYSERPVMRPMGTDLDLRARRKDGGEVPVEISLSPIRAEDGYHTIAIMRDVSARRKAEDQLRELNRELELRNDEVERSNRLKSEFLASMSHELRSPLHTIIGFAELLGEELEGPLNTKQKRFVRNIHQDSHHLLAIINDLLDISKIEAGRMEIHVEAFDIEAAIDEVAATVEQQAAAKSIRLERHCPEGAAAETDRLRFKQILVNLLTNAIKFTPDAGRVRITVMPRGERVAIAVSDTGIGIARQDQEAIFDKFYQVGATTKGVREGTGLGLAITRQLVEQQGGRIWVDSEPGQGSVFLFTVGAPAAKPSESQPLILIVEPERRAAELLVNYLEPEGFLAFRTRSAAQALPMACELQADAVIVDIGAASPDAEEWQLVRQLRATPDTAAMPVILISVTEEGGQARGLGVNAHLTKPVGKRVLLEALGRCVHPGSRPAEVLVADDDESARELLCEFLHDAGYRARQAANGLEALSQLGVAKPDAIVLDLMMPGMSGFEVLARLRETPEWATIPVVVLTGLELKKGDVDLLERTAVAILSKGESWKQPLIDAIRQAVGTARITN